MNTRKSVLRTSVTSAAILCVVLFSVTAFAGGPMLAGSAKLGRDGKPITWNPASMPITYRVDGGPLSSTIANTAALARIRGMLDIWQNVPTAAISYSYAGPITATGAFTDGDVSTLAEFDAVMASCEDGTQNPVIMDSNGAIANELGMDDSVIAFAGVCRISNGYITAGFAFLNGIWQDGIRNYSNPEISSSQFDYAITHELGHFSGLDHSLINYSWRYDTCSIDDLAGRPLMSPILDSCGTRTDSGLPMLATDDLAWISYLYPAPTFSQEYGTISGYIVFSDGLSQVQGANVIARRVEDSSTVELESHRYSVSVVSGFLFTGNPGQQVTAQYLACSPASSCPQGYDGNNVDGSLFGSRDPLLIGYYKIPVPKGTYTVEVQHVLEQYSGGSSVGPLDPPIRLPGAPEYWDNDESDVDDTSAATPITVGAGQDVKDINIILNGTPKRFDNFEDNGKLTDLRLTFPSATSELRTRYQAEEVA